jgi:hypothetical protein
LVHAEADPEEQRLPSRPEEVQKEEHVPSQMEDAMQLDRTPVEEEPPPPGDTTFGAFCMPRRRTTTHTGDLSVVFVYCFVMCMATFHAFVHGYYSYAVYTFHSCNDHP